MIVHQEGLPAYWGIETLLRFRMRQLHNRKHIRKDYPLTGVLKLFDLAIGPSVAIQIRKDYPLTGVLKLFNYTAVRKNFNDYQEGLPAYWGIETLRSRYRAIRSNPNQEGLPAYWGIETIQLHRRPKELQRLSGRITRLLGY